ncbi:MAG: hypothetical protein PHH26_08205 [Candidatus Thermoplasmatota archaeon]|nr:hypothetical protein [Candidatus Thermoplasmatota archaeon]
MKPSLLNAPFDSKKYQQRMDEMTRVKHGFATPKVAAPAIPAPAPAPAPAHVVLKAPVHKIKYKEYDPYKHMDPYKGTFDIYKDIFEKEIEFDK